ncbi:ATP-binding protein [Actinophytocola oryzae]|uniref:ATP-binding protein n=1 Tax=Actinophytocola oryzae TaxID=502181 RepID=UPI001FBB5713|nr:ATP-binding protein [Actinophytocola oryzae]
METRAPVVAELRLAERSSSAAVARQFTRSTLARWQNGTRGEHVEDAVLVVSELVTNALLHGHGTPLVRLLGSGDRIRVEICDDSPLLPIAPRVTPSGGLGLRVVEQLSSAWGASRRGRGKVVWCELPAAPDPTELD